VGGSAWTSWMVTTSELVADRLGVLGGGVDSSAMGELVLDGDERELWDGW
jgi:hypothetical protein